jgi:phosphoenolpyruvate synthase/pyruvate phosphate dikinase
MTMFCVTDYEASDLTTDVVGGKAAALATLCGQGFDVPRFHVLTTEAFRSHVAQEPLATAWAAYDGSTAQNAGMRQLVIGAPLPGNTLQEIARAEEHLPAPITAGLIAVRSSASDEDGQTRSYAGQMVSELGVSAAKLPAAIRQCWASFFGDRVAEYRRQHALKADASGMALILQVQLFPEKAGVLYTRSPRPDGDKACYIEANYGTGESVVGGRATPDGYECARWSGDIVFRHLGSKQRMSIVARNGGSAEVEVPDDRRRQPVLADLEVRQIVEVGRRIERAYGRPQDVEWAIDEHGLWVLQSRPITVPNEVVKE